MAIKPLYEVLRAMDGERFLQMGFLYYMMERTKEQIKMTDPQHADEYIRIIDHRWSYQMSRKLHLVGKQQIKNFQNLYNKLNQLRKPVCSLLSESKVPVLHTWYWHG